MAVGVNRRYQDRFAETAVDLKRWFNGLPAVVGMKSPGGVRVSESPSPSVGWLNSGRGRETPKKRRAALHSSMVREVKRAALR